MNKFMIGQYGVFNEKKQKRDFREGFLGVEACLLRDNQEVDRLVNSSKKHGYQIGIHFPLVKSEKYLRDAQFMSKDPQRKQDAYNYIEEQLRRYNRVKPMYILFHYPKPVILDDEVDWSDWRFADETEYYYESEYSFDEFVTQSEELFQWLEDKGQEFDFIPVLEMDTVNKYLIESDILEELLKSYPSIRICLDIARLHQQAVIDTRFDPYSFMRKTIKYCGNIHLSNVQAGHSRETNHYPALRELRFEEGWANVAEYFSIIKEHNAKCKILFEHKSDIISVEQLEDCYQWIAELLS